MNTYEEILSRLSSKTRTRSLLNGVELSIMSRIIANMNEVLQEKRNKKEMEKQKRQAKIAIITHLKKTLQDNGLSLSDLRDMDLANNTTDKKAAAQKEKYTFQYENLSGDVIFWYGSASGRLPRAFQEYLNRTGRKRMDCIITDQDSHDTGISESL